MINHEEEEEDAENEDNHNDNINVSEVKVFVGCLQASHGFEQFSKKSDNISKHIPIFLLFYQVNLFIAIVNIHNVFDSFTKTCMDVSESFISMVAPMCFKPSITFLSYSQRLLLLE